MAHPNCSACTIRYQRHPHLRRLSFDLGGHRHRTGDRTLVYAIVVSVAIFGFWDYMSRFLPDVNDHRLKAGGFLLRLKAGLVRHSADWVPETNLVF